MRANDPSQDFDIDAETVSLVQSVTVSHALALLQAMRVSEALETIDQLRAAGARRTPFDTEHLTANLLCWRGSLGAADLSRHREVQQACAAAVQLSAGTNFLNGHRDSRGLNRARTGDIAGAIDDFRAFAYDTLYAEDVRAQRRRWIAMLDKGEDPFTADELGQAEAVTERIRLCREAGVKRITVHGPTYVRDAAAHGGRTRERGAATARAPVKFGGARHLRSRAAGDAAGRCEAAGGAVARLIIAAGGIALK